MKKSYQFFIWIVLMVLGLITVLVITQVNTSRSADRLVSGNKQAAATFTINNRIEELVNLSFELEAKILTEKPGHIFSGRTGITDSVEMLLQKSRQLSAIMHEVGIPASLDKIINLVNEQAALSSAILSSANNNLLADSLAKKHFGDSIYISSLAFQVGLEKELSATLRENNQVAEKVSWLNKLLALTALLAILLLATIIIRRQVMQFMLIRDLEQARKVALQSVKVKDQFLANMSHEIRTPLNALKGFSNLLSKTPLTDEQQQYSTIINNSSESLLHIVNDILDLSKIEAGALAIKARNFNLHALLKDLEFTYAAVAKEKNLAFVIESAKDTGNNITGDPERLKQVLVNLISNAIKFTHEGSIRLRVNEIEKNEESATIDFSVQDTGIGIPPDKHELIFERFEQLDNAFIRQQGGTGLGLAITKMIVESMGSSIKVESEAGKGSVFSFAIRFKVSNQQLADNQLLAAQEADAPRRSPGKAVMLAEDNRVNQILVRKLLATYDIEPVVAENGEEVLALLEKQAFDLILMDVQMPLLDGITTTRLIRKYITQRIPIVGMTAYVMPNEIEKCYAAGMNDHIPKPIDEEQLLSVIKKYIYLDEGSFLQEGFVKKEIPAELLFLLQLCNGNEEAMQKILVELEKQLPADSSEFREALLAKNNERMRRVIHHMKSTVSPLGPDSAVVKAVLNMSELLQSVDGWPLIETAGNKLLAELNDTLQMIRKALNPQLFATN